MPPTRGDVRIKVQPPPGNIVAPNGFPADPRPVGASQEFLDAMEIRIKVFCDEQKCAIEPELDEDDPKSWSWIAYQSLPGSETEVPVATIRLTPPPHAPHPNGFQDPDEEPYVKLSRVATISQGRGQGLNKTLMDAAFLYLSSNPSLVGADWKGLVLTHAQVYIEGMYVKLGFVTDERLGRWDEEGIEHLAPSTGDFVDPYRLEVSRSQRILWLLEELKIPYELKTYKRGADKLADPKLKEVHPLGKSPIITIDRGDDQEPLVLIESAAMSEYLCDYYGKWLIPARYPAGKEGQIGSETEAWLRYRTFMHYAEGSLMPLNVIALIMGTIRNSSVPFFIKPITNGVADRVTSLFLQPNFETHYGFVESQLKTSPDSGEYLCGNTFTVADILMSYPLEAGKARSGLTEEQCPRVWKYTSMLKEREAWKRAVKKIEEIEGSFKTHL